MLRMDGGDLSDCMEKLLVLMRKLDQKIAPMLEADGHHFNLRWVGALEILFVNYFNSMFEVGGTNVVSGCKEICGCV